MKLEGSPSIRPLIYLETLVNVFFSWVLAVQAPMGNICCCPTHVGLCWARLRVTQPKHSMAGGEGRLLGMEAKESSKKPWNWASSIGVGRWGDVSDAGKGQAVGSGSSWQEHCGKEPGLGGSECQAQPGPEPGTHLVTTK